MTAESDEEVTLIPGPSTNRTGEFITPKFSRDYSNETWCNAPSNKNTKRAIEVCRTLIPSLTRPRLLPRMKKA